MLKTKTTTAPEWHQTEFDFKTGTLPDEVACDTAIHGKAKSNGSDASLRTESNIEHAICPRTALRTLEPPGPSIFGDQSHKPTL